jgi:hypothetical protein
VFASSFLSAVAVLLTMLNVLPSFDFSDRWVEFVILEVACSGLEWFGVV